MSFSLTDLLDTITVKYGTRAVSQKHGTEYYFIPKTERKYILGILVTTIKDLGEDKEYFKRSDVKAAILRACFNEFTTKQWNSEKREGAKRVLFRELGEILAEVWPDKTSHYQAPDAPAVPAEEAQELPKNYEEFDPEKQGRMGRDIDTSVNTEEPAADVEFDEEAAILLGLKR